MKKKKAAVKSPNPDIMYLDKEGVGWKFEGFRLFRLHPDGEEEMHNGDLSARIRHQGRIITEKEARSLAAMNTPLHRDR